LRSILSYLSVIKKTSGQFILHNEYASYKKDSQAGLTPKT
jgi:hypothetical protein